MNGQIFISYRRDDTSGSSGRLYDRLAKHFGKKKIFMDVDRMSPGQDFVKAMETSVSSSDVLIAVIGKSWLQIHKKRIEDKTPDFVRMEINEAIKRNIRVIPILVEGGTVPDNHDLSDDIKSLSSAHALEIRHTSFDVDVDKFIQSLMNILSEIQLTRESKRKLDADLRAIQEKKFDEQRKPASFNGSSSHIMITLASAMILIILLYNAYIKNQKSKEEFQTNANIDTNIKKAFIPLTDTQKVTQTPSSDSIKPMENEKNDTPVVTAIKKREPSIAKVDLQNAKYCSMTSGCSYYMKFYDYNGKIYKFIAYESAYNCSGTAKLHGNDIVLINRFGNSEATLSDNGRYLTGTIWNEHGKEMSINYELSKIE